MRMNLPKWRIRIGLFFAAASLLLTSLLITAVPVVLDLRSFLLSTSALSCILLSIRQDRKSRPVLFVASLAGIAAFATAFDLWINYRTEDIRFTGGNGVELAGTIYSPRASARHPGIVLIHGSGRETRDEYRFYARRFARAGIVTLAYDKRGSGASSGDFNSAGYEEFAADAIGAVKVLRARRDVDAVRVGIWGLSEGEWVGALTAVKTEPAFLVLISPSAMTPSEQVAYESGSNVLRAGYSSAYAALARELYGRIANFQRTGTGRDELNRQLAAYKSKPWFGAARYLSESVPEYDRVLALDWFPTWRKRMDFDALPLYARIRCPVLIQIGGDDPKNDGRAALERLRKAFAQGKNSRFTGRFYPSGGHGMILWKLPDHVPPPFFAHGYLEEQLEWIQNTMHF